MALAQRMLRQPIAHRFKPASHIRFSVLTFRNTRYHETQVPTFRIMLVDRDDSAMLLAKLAICPGRGDREFSETIATISLHMNLQHFNGVPFSAGSEPLSIVSRERFPAPNDRACRRYQEIGRASCRERV